MKTGRRSRWPFLLLTTLIVAGLTAAVPARASLQYVGPLDLGGQGLGAVLTVLTVLDSQSANLKGCVSWSGSADVLGQAYDASTFQCTGSAAQVQTGASQTLTRTLAEVFQVGQNASALAVVYNTNQIGKENDIQLNQIVMTVWDASGAKIYQASTDGSEIFNPGQLGIGNSGFEFVLDSTQQGTFNTAVFGGGTYIGSYGAYRIGLSVDTGTTAYPNNDGGETLKLVNLGSVTVPEPSSIVLLVSTLIGAGILLRRRYRA